VRAVAADHELFARLYAAHDQLVRRYLGKRVPDHHLVEDLTQETWAKVWRAIRRVRVDDSGGLQAWLTSIARNTLTDHFRRVSLRPVSLAGDGAVFELHPSLATGPEEAAVAADEWAADLACLPQRHQLVMRLRCELEFTEQETADALGIRPGTVKSRTHHGRRAVARRRRAAS